MSIFSRRHKQGKKKLQDNAKPEKSELVKYIETNSTVAPTGKVVIISNKKKVIIDWFPASPPTTEILKTFVEMQKLPNVSNYYYE